MNFRLNSYDYFINGEYDNQLILKFIIEELRSGVNSKRFKTQTLRMFNILLLLNEEHQFDIYNNRRIQNIIDGKVNEFVGDVEETQLLALYSESLFSQGISYFADFLIKLMKSEFEKEDEQNQFNNFAIKLITSFVGYVFNEKLIIRIRQPFTTFFKSQEDPLVAYVDKENIKPLVTEEIFNFILSKITTISKEDYWLEDVRFIVENKVLGSDENEVFFERLNAIRPNFTNLTTVQITDILKQVILVLSKLDMKKQKEKPQFIAFFNKIFANRSVNNRNVNFLSEALNIPENTEIIVDYLYWSYRIVHYFKETTPFFNQIANSNITNRNLVNKAILRLQKENGYTLIPIYDVVLSDKTYSETSFKLLEYVFRSKNDKDEYRLEYSKLDIKIKEMSSHIFEESDKLESITSFFEKMIDITPFKESLSNIISSQSKVHILLLSIKLQHLAFDKITEADVLFDYEDNIELLNAISESGEKRHKIKLVNVIVRKIPKQDTQDDAFTILEHSSGFNKRDTGKIIKLLEEFSDNAELAERISNIISTLNAKQIK